MEESREARAATDAGGGDGSGAGIAGTAAPATLSEGDEIDGIVSAVSADTLAIAVAPGLTARVPKIETGDSIAALRKALTSRFTVGERVKMTALAADIARKKIIVTLRSADKRNVVEGAKLRASSPRLPRRRRRVCPAQLQAARSRSRHRYRG